VNLREMKIFPWMAHLALKVVDVPAGMITITDVTMDTTAVIIIANVRSGLIRTLLS
jgi:hypothetical protein